MPVDNPDWATGPLDRDELHRQMQEQELHELLDDLRGRWGDHLDEAIAEFGEQVRQPVNMRLSTDFKEPLHTEAVLVGYRTLLYELANGIKIEEEIGKKSNNSET